MLRIRSSMVNLLLAIFMIPVVLVLYQNSGSNKHTHILPCGAIIEHSHPYKKSDSGQDPISHGHDALGFIFLGQLSDTETNTALFCPDLANFDQFVEIKSLFCSVPEQEAKWESNPSRGPPCFSLI